MARFLDETSLVSGMVSGQKDFVGQPNGFPVEAHRTNPVLSRKRISDLCQ